MQGTFAISMGDLINELFHNFESMPEWNPAVTYCEVVQVHKTKTMYFSLS